MGKGSTVPVPGNLEFQYGKAAIATWRGSMLVYYGQIQAAPESRQARHFPDMLLAALKGDWNNEPRL